MSSKKIILGAVAVSAPFLVAFGVMTVPIATIFSPSPETVAEACELLSAGPADSSSIDVTDDGSTGQLRYVGLMSEIGKKRGVAEKGRRLAVMVAKQESNIRNLDRGDRDSVGLFQQRPSQGWGTKEQLQDPVYAINAFYDALLATPGWESMSYLDAGLAVQRPSREAYLSNENYFPGWQPLADKLLKLAEASDIPGGKLLTSASLLLTQEELCDKIEALVAGQSSPEARIVASARSAIGRKIDSTSLVGDVFAAAGAELPDTLQSLIAYRGDTTAGVRAEWIDGADILDKSEELHPSDILFYSGSSSTSKKDVASAGIFSGPSVDGITVASANVLGSSHTVNKGPAQSGPNRVAGSFELFRERGFAVVGLQEFQSNQRKRLVREIRESGGGYGIYPAQANYGKRRNMPFIDSTNSVLYDRSQVEVVQTSELPMPMYYDQNRKNIPLILFRVLATGQEFYFVNSHDPARPENAQYRKLAGDQRASDLNRLAATGTTVVYACDCNAGNKLRYNGNVTLGNKLANLTTRIIERSRKIVNAFKVACGTNAEACPRYRSIDPIDHIFVSAGTPVSKWERIDPGPLSDHPYIAATIGSTAPADETSLGRMVIPGKNGIVQEREVSTKGLIGVLRITISEPPAGEGIVANGEWALPVPKGYRLTGRFGQCGQFWENCHTGLDFAISSGSPIYAVTSGTIVGTGDAGAYGNRTVQRLPDGSEVWYCHQNSFVLKSGPVQAGTLIGYVGSTGNTTGPHLHIEFRPGGGDPVDPETVFRQHGLSP